MKTERIIFIVGGLGIGGTETYLLRLITDLVSTKKDIEVIIICKLGVKGELEDDFTKLGVRIEALKLGPFPNLAYAKLYSLFRVIRKTAVIDFTGNFAVLPLIIAKLAGIKTRVAFYRTSGNRFSPSVLRTLYNFIQNRLLKRVASTILLNSKTAKEFFFPKCKSQKIKVIYNGFDISNFLNNGKSVRKEYGIPESAYVVGHIGRLNPAKNHITMIDIANEVCTKNREIYFLFCGKDVNKLDKLIKFDNKGHILLLKPQKDVKPLLATFDSFLFLSTSEGQPNALIEAMITNKAIIASNIPAISEFVFYTNGCTLVDPLDQLTAIQIILRYAENNVNTWCNNTSDFKEFTEQFCSRRRFKDVFDVILKS